ncbi:phage baseplate assembly protein V [bacterium]|nr:phage baseplate assembly protein V [bacterium]
MKEYQAKVTNITDPDKRNFVQVRVFEMFPEGLVPDSDLPWAEFKLPPGAGFNEGAFHPVRVGHYVWVDFPYRDEKGNEDTRRPRITGGCHLCPDGLPNMPHDAFDGPRSLDGLFKYPKGDDGNVDPDYEETKDSVFSRSAAFTKEGFSFRVQNGALTVTHLKTGSRFEITENGYLDLFTAQNGFIRAAKKLVIKAAELVLISSKKIGFEFPELEQKINTWILETSSFSVTSKGLAKIVGKAVQLLSDTDFSVTTQGKQSFSSSGSILQSIDQNTTTDPLKAWGAELHISGVPMASLLLDPTGLFEMKNTTANLKLIIDGIIDEISLITVSPGYGIGANVAALTAWKTQLAALMK